MTLCFIKINLDGTLMRFPGNHLVNHLVWVIYICQKKNKLVYDIIITLNMSSRLTFDADCDAHSVVIFRMMGTTLTRSLTG